jgi:hypothetical protein
MGHSMWVVSGIHQMRCITYMLYSRVPPTGHLSSLLLLVSATH